MSHDIEPDLLPLDQELHSLYAVAEQYFGWRLDRWWRRLLPMPRAMRDLERAVQRCMIVEGNDYETERIALLRKAGLFL